MLMPLGILDHLFLSYSARRFQSLLLVLDGASPCCKRRQRGLISTAVIRGSRDTYSSSVPDLVQLLNCSDSDGQSQTEGKYLFLLYCLLSIVEQNRSTFPLFSLFTNSSSKSRRSHGPQCSKCTWDLSIGDSAQCNDTASIGELFHSFDNHEVPISFHVSKYLLNWSWKHWNHHFYSLNRTRPCKIEFRRA